MTVSRKAAFLMGLCIPVLFYLKSAIHLRHHVGKGQVESPTPTESFRKGILESKILLRDNPVKFSREKDSTSPKSDQKLVILYSNQRSGSTFTGEIFNRNPEAFYLYEPLFPFTPHCNSLSKERVTALDTMLRCDHTQNRKIFTSAQRVTKFRDTLSSGCIKNGICFAGNSEATRKRYPEYCKEKFSSSECSFPPKANVISSMCAESTIVAYKVLRVCSLQDIDELYQRFSKEGRSVYVIHLIRDPRAIISSKLQLELKPNDVLVRTRELCGKMERNLEFVENSTEIPSIVKSANYLRVRYEDAATFPLRTAEDIYRFIGLPLPDEVREWLEVSTLTSGQRRTDLKNQLKVKGKKKREVVDEYSKLQKQMNNPYGTVKDPTTTVQKWRKLLPLDTTIQIQKLCSKVMQIAGYKPVWTSSELLDSDTKLWM